MIQKKYLKLMEYLKGRNTVSTAKEISLALNISVRSVKSYVREINTIAKSNIISSERTGYTINKKVADFFIQNENNGAAFPQTWEERFNYIFQIFYSERCHSINVYDLCDELYISLSTLRSDIEKINHSLENYHVNFSIEKNELFLKAEEKNIRKLKTSIIYSELNQPLIDLSWLSNEFPELSVSSLTRFIAETLRKHHLSMNEIAFGNFILHLCVIADRPAVLMQPDRSENIPVMSDNMETASVEIIEYMKDRMKISLSDTEIYTINILLKSNANLIFSSDEEAISYIGKDILSLCHRICQKVKYKYDIELENQSFLIPFAIHLKSMLFRLEHGYEMRNHMSDTIKKSNPYIFDLAVFVSIQIADEKGVAPAEDEIAYIAVHLGAELQRQENDMKKIQAVLYFSNYMHSSQKMYETIIRQCGAELHIVKIVNTFEELSEVLQEVDLVITDFPLSHISCCEIFQISPVMSPRELLTLEELCGNLRQKKQCMILAENFEKYFSPELFFSNIKPGDSKEDLIRFMADQIIKTGIIEESFKEDVLTRERSASTGFSGIAIPHGTKVNASESHICVMIRRDGINWDKHIVYLVMMFALDQHDQHVFPQLYEALVYIFQKENALQKLKNVKTYQEFKKTILGLIA